MQPLAALGDPRVALRRLASANDDYVRALGEHGLELQ